MGPSPLDKGLAITSIVVVHTDRRPPHAFISRSVFERPITEQPTGHRQGKELYSEVRDEAE